MGRAHYSRWAAEQLAGSGLHHLPSQAAPHHGVHQGAGMHHALGVHGLDTCTHEDTHTQGAQRDASCKGLGAALDTPSTRTFTRAAYTRRASTGVTPATAKAEGSTLPSTQSPCASATTSHAASHRGAGRPRACIASSTARESKVGPAPDDGGDEPGWGSRLQHTMHTSKQVRNGGDQGDAHPHPHNTVQCTHRAKAAPTGPP